MFFSTILNRGSGDVHLYSSRSCDGISLCRTTCCCLLFLMFSSEVLEGTWEHILTSNSLIQNNLEKIRKMSIWTCEAYYNLFTWFDQRLKSRNNIEYNNDSRTYVIGNSKKESHVSWIDGTKITTLHHQENLWRFSSK